MPVQYEKRGPIGIVTLSRPQARNAWGADFNEGIARHFAAMEDDDEIRCALLTGDEAGGAFSAGANLNAVGIGCIVTFCCDLLVASDRAEWRLPQVALRILPAYGGAARLARWVGRGNAMRLALGFPLSAGEALRIRLAPWVGAPASLLGKT